MTRIWQKASVLSLSPCSLSRFFFLLVILSERWVLKHLDEITWQIHGRTILKCDAMTATSGRVKKKERRKLRAKEIKNRARLRRRGWEISSTQKMNAFQLFSCNWRQIALRAYITAYKSMRSAILTLDNFFFFCVFSRKSIMRAKKKYISARKIIKLECLLFVRNLIFVKKRFCHVLLHY